MSDEGLESDGPQAKDLRKFLQEIRNIDLDLRSPVVAFTAAADLLRVSKGALLLRSHDVDSFVVWAQRGLDETTRHRLEFPRQKISQLIRDMGLDSQLTQAQKIAAVSPYVSNLEASMLRSALLLSFPETEPQALFLILDSPYLTDEESSVVLLLAAVAEPIVDAVDNKMLRQLRAVSNVRQLSRKSFIHHVVEHVRHSDLAGHLVQVKVQPMIDYLTEQHPELDQFRCFQDLASLILQVIGTAFPALLDPSRRIWVHVPAGNDIELLIGHLAEVVRARFTVPATFDVLTHEDTELFQTAEHVHTQLDSILADVQD